MRAGAGVMGASGARPAWIVGGLVWARGAPSACDGEEAGHGGAVVLDAVDLDGAAVLLHHLVADGETEAEAALLGREERIEDTGTRGGRDARALVDHLHLHHAALAGPHVHLG